MLSGPLFRQRVAQAIAKVEERPGWDRKRLINELGLRSSRTLDYWVDGRTQNPPFFGIVRLAELSGYPFRWFNGEVSDEDVQSGRELAIGAADLARTITGAIAEQSAEIAGLRREMQAMRRSLINRAVIAGPLGLPAAGETGGAGELHDLRVAAGLSIQQVAVRLNISVKRAAEYEAGETPIEPEMLERWRDLTSS